MSEPAGGREARTHRIIRPDGTPEVLVELARDPTARIGCIMGEDPLSDGAMSIWHMPLGCIALHRGAPAMELPQAPRDFRVQPLCYHHTNRQEPLWQPDTAAPPYDQATMASAPPELLVGSELLVDLTIGRGSNFPESPWAESGPHWSDTAAQGQPLPPALELGFGMDDLRTFAASTPLGQLVFHGYEYLLR